MAGGGGGSVLVAAVIEIALTVAGIAEDRAGKKAETGPDGSSFEAASTLVADDAADAGARETAGDGAALLAGAGTIAVVGVVVLTGAEEDCREEEGESFHGGKVEYPMSNKEDRISKAGNCP